MNLAEVLFQSETRFGDGIAVTDLGTGCVLTYQGLAHEARAIASFLSSQGVRAGQRIGLLAPNGAAYMAAAFGLLAAGACIVPIAANLAGSEVRRILTEIDVHACFVAPDTGAAHGIATAVTTGPCTGFSFYWTQQDAPDSDGFLAMNAAFVRFTSGTTAQARGVVISHEGTLARVNASNRVLQITEHDRVLWVLPLAYHFAVTITAYVQAGAHTIMCPDALPQIMVDAIRRFAATVLYASPLHFERLAGLKADSPLAGLRLTLSTSAPIRRDVIEKFEAVYRVPVCQAYGIIEAGLPCINTRHDGTPPTSVGRPVPGYEIAIADENGHHLPAGSKGEVLIRGDGLFMGYYKPWQPFKESARGGWLATGDIGSFDAAGALTLSGRKKALISMGGVKFFPEEVEERINRFPGIKESRVFGRAHAHLGEIPCGEIVTTTAIDLNSLRQHCLQSLSSYKVPINFIVVDAVPRTAGGKILRQRVTETASSHDGH